MPVILGLIGIVAFFYWQNENFLSAGNFTNLMAQMAAVTTIAIGVVFVLLLGEIDLSIGYVSGIAGRRRREAPVPRRELADDGHPRDHRRGDRDGAHRPAPGQLRRDHRRPVVRRHAGRAAVLAGRDPLLDRRPGRDRDRRLARSTTSRTTSSPTRPAILIAAIAIALFALSTLAGVVSRTAPRDSTPTT